MSKKNLALKGFAVTANDKSDEVNHYTNIFPSAIPLVYNHESAHPLESRFNEAYGNTFFLIYKPLGINSTGFMDEKPNMQPFYLLLVRNAHTAKQQNKMLWQREAADAERRQRQSIFAVPQRNRACVQGWKESRCGRRKSSILSISQ